MYMNEKTNDKELKTRNKKTETTKERVRRHIENKDDKITEEDLRDAVVGSDAVDLENPDEPSITVKDIPEKKKDVVTPWDVLENDETEEPK
jgi:hypothetical protein